MNKRGFFGLIGKIVTVVVILLVIGVIFLFFSLKDKYTERVDDFGFGDDPSVEEEILEIIDAEKISFDLHTDSKLEEDNLIN